MDRAAAISRYAKAVSVANNEAAKKELFINLLNELFGGKDSFGIISKFATGSEKSITNIDRVGKKSQSGRADTQYGTVIIEFENDLKKTGSHARDQLADYLVGNWNSGIKSRFTLIATDCITWIIYAPDYSSLIGLGQLKADKIALDKVTEFKVEPGKGDEFYFFLDRYLFGTEPVPATLEDIRKRFGQGSDIFQSVIYHMHQAYESIKNTPEMQVARTHWERFLRIAYGKFNAADYIFLIHSYLSVLAKMIAYEVISGDDYIDDGEIADIVTGEVFRKKNIVNFTDNDFFRWTAANLPKLKEAFRSIADGLSEMDFSNVDEDILKGVYQELVDDDTRHSLGECYTPDWLCARVVEEMKPKTNQKILDPSCGSGSFLKASANYLISEKPEITASELNECLYGVDVHPLSVQITKATLLIAYGKRLAAEKEPLRLNVYLANSLLLPTEEADLLGKIYRVAVDTKKIEIPATLFTDYKSLSKLVEITEFMAEMDFQARNEKKDSELTNIFKNRGYESEPALRSATALYHAFMTAKKENHDGIWGYILANTYAPIALKEQFDLVIGNPPWLTFSDISAKDYQDEVKSLADKTEACPDKQTLITHIELAALFVGQCATYFLKPDGKLAFVMPRSIFSADHHDRLRKGKIKSFIIDSLWDLVEVNPLFKVPSCVLFGRRTATSRRKKDKIDGLAISGKLPNTNSGKEVAKNRLKSEKTVFYLSNLNERTAWSETPIKIIGSLPYKNQFNQGATLVPRSLCFVDIDQDIEGDLRDRIIRIKSASAVYKDAKAPWNQKSVSGRIHTKYLFRTLLANNIVPFGSTGSYLVALPIEIKGKRIEMTDDREIELGGDIESAQFFKKAFAIWDRHKTDKNAKISMPDYLNWQNKLEKQGLNKRYTVLYNSSGSYAASVTLDENSFDLPLVIESISYYFKTNEEHEAWYLCAYLNSDVPNRIIKPFQARGLFGARHIHKKILDIPFPAYDPGNQLHTEAAELAKTAAAKVTAFIQDQGFDSQGNNLTALETGRLRSRIRQLVNAELDQIDQKIQTIIAGG